MDSATIRWILAGLFVAFVVGVVISDVIKRRSKASKQPKKPKRPEGFRPAAPARPQRQSSWKSGARR